ncbi:MAG: amino acid ABC transporter permease, partial [Comamonas sp.]
YLYAAATYFVISFALSLAFKQLHKKIAIIR